MRNLNYLLLTVLLLSACGGDKNESTANGNAVFAVRTFEDGGTEVALLNGNFSTEDGALAAAENARWVEVDEFPLYPGWDLDVLVALPSAQAVGITVLISGAIESEAGFMNSRYVVIAMFK